MCFYRCKMTILKRFNETGQEINSEDAPVTVLDIQQCLTEYGTDWVTGYRMGISDFLPRVDALLEAATSGGHVTKSRTFYANYREQEFFLNTSLFNRIREHGSKWEQGYINAVSDFHRQIDLVIFDRVTFDPPYYGINSDKSISSNLSELRRRQSDFITIADIETANYIQKSNTVDGTNIQP